MKYKISLVLYILILGLIPLLWFDGQLITGTDINFSPFPWERFIERSYSWNPELFAGAERAINVSSLSYVGTSGLLNVLLNDVVTVEMLTYTIWFALTGFSIAFLLSRLFSEERDEDKFLILLFGILIYMVNFYNIFLWVRLQLLVTALVFVPILLGVLHEIFHKNRLSRIDILILFIATVLGGPLGKQPPLIYVILMAMFVYVVFYLSIDLFVDRSSILKKLNRLFVVLSIGIVASAYWIGPLGNFIFRSGLLQGSKTGAELYDVRRLLSWTSEHTSNLNIFRNFGDAPWFDGWGEQLYFPEFIAFYQDDFFMVLSFAVLFVIFLSLYATTNRGTKKIVTVFGLITLMSLFFAKGIHAPFSSVFEWAFQTLPGFWIHRAPWQKFGLITSVGFAVLGGYGALHAVKILHSKLRTPKLLVTTMFVAMYLLFNNLFVTGKMFPSKDAEIGFHGSFDLGFHHTYPDYLYEIREYFQELSDKNYSVLLLPEDRANVYDWGYASSMDIASTFLRSSTIYKQYGEGLVLDGYIGNVYNAIVAAIYSGNGQQLGKVFDFFNIQKLIQRNDFTYNFSGDMDSPEFIEKRLSNLDYLLPKKIFGEWDVYDVNSQYQPSMFYLANKFVDITSVTDNILLPVMLGGGKNTVLLEEPGKEIWQDEVFYSSSGIFVDKIKDKPSGEKTTECVGYCYPFEIQERGSYELFILESNYTALSQKDYVVTVLNNNVEQSNSSANSYNLIEGENIIQLEGPREENFRYVNHATIHKSQLMKEIGSKLIIRKAAITDYFPESKLTPYEENLRELHVSNIEKFTYDIHNFSAEYQLNVNYKSNARTGIVVVESPHGDAEAKVMSSIFSDSPHRGINSYSQRIRTSNGAKSLTFYLFSLGDSGDHQLIEPVAITLSRELDPNIILRKQISSLTAPENVMPVVSFEKIDPTKFLVRLSDGGVSENFALVMNQTFNPLWKLYKGVGKRRENVLSIFETSALEEIGRDSHYRSNYFGNAWYLSPAEIDGAGYLIVEFSTQKLFYWGILVLILALIVIVIVNVNALNPFRKILDKKIVPKGH